MSKYSKCQNNIEERKNIQDKFENPVNNIQSIQSVVQSKEDKVKENTKNYKDHSSENSNCRFSSCKNYLITYENQNYSEIFSHFNTKYNKKEIESIESQENRVLVSLNFNRPKKLRLCHRDLFILERFYPFSIQNFRYPFVETNKNENLLLNEDDQNNLSKKNNEKIDDRFPWLYDKVYNYQENWKSNDVLLNFDYKKLKHDFNIELFNFLFKIKDFNGTNFCNIFKKLLNNINIAFYSEYLISAIILNSLIELNESEEIKNQISNIKIIGVDHKFQEFVNGIRTNFRCVKEY